MKRQERRIGTVTSDSLKRGVVSTRSFGSTTVTSFSGFVGTYVEHGVRYPDGVVLLCDREADARWRAERDGAEYVTREVPAWRKG